MTTTDQDRRIQDRSIELGAASVEIVAIGPKAADAILARYTDRDGKQLAVERIRRDGSAHENVLAWLRRNLRWTKYAGKTVATIATLLLLAPAAATAAPRSTIHTLGILEETVPCEHGGRVLAIRERDTGLRLLRDPERPAAYLRRVNPELAAWRGWELDRREAEDRGLVRYTARWPRAELANFTSAAIRVRVRCDGGASR